MAAILSRSQCANAVAWKLTCWVIMERIRVSSLNNVKFMMACSENIITVTSLWVRWRLKSPASPLFTQGFIQSQIKESIKAPRHWPLCRKRWPVNSPHKWPVTQKMIPFDDVIMYSELCTSALRFEHFLKWHIWNRILVSKITEPNPSALWIYTDMLHWIFL